MTAERRCPMRKTIFLLPALAAMLLTGCGDQQSCTVTLRNLTGYEIASAQIAQESDDSNHTDRLDGTALPNGEARALSLGKYSEDELAEGFSALIELADGSEEDFSRLILKDGDVLTIYIDDLSISAAVNVSDEEVAAMIRHVHESLRTDES